MLLLAALVALTSDRPSAQAPDDRDSDGVVDASDCAPADPRLSSPHLYYWDLDGDQFGDASNPLYLCATTPYGGTALWGSDPDDRDSLVIGRLRAKGARVLGLDLLDTSEDRVWRGDLPREVGADAASVTLHWSLIESAPGVFDGPEVAALAALNTRLAEDGIALNLTVAPITGRHLTTPADLAAGLTAGTRRWNDPAIIGRYRRLLEFVRQALPSVSLVSLQVGHEVDLLLPAQPAPQFWADYEQFFLAARTNAHVLWRANLPVGITATAAGVTTEPAAALMRYLTASAELVSVTYLPHGDDYMVPDPNQVPFVVAALIAAAHPKSLSFQALGYPSSSRVGSSTTRQAQFIQAFFDTWDLYAELISYAAFTRLHDYDPARAVSQAAALGAPASLQGAAAAWIGSMGLRTYASAGQHKPAYQTLRTQALNRGWWHVRPATNRSFLLGFTPALYDHNPGGALMPEVLTNIGQAIAPRADLIAFHFDGGIPWPDAFADPMTGTDPPYSQHLRDWWGAHRALTPPGARVLVAINPLGIPRSVVAPYWGLGEGFYHDASFNRVGTGVIQDYQDRLPPAPWNTYRLNALPVKTAFLKYAKRTIDYFGADYLVTGIEVNLAFEENRAFYDDYVELQQYVYTQLKADPRYAHVKVIVSFVAEYLITDELGVPVTEGAHRVGIEADHLQALQRIVPFTDLIGLSLYPIKTRYLAYQFPAGLIDDLFTRIRRITDKPIAITETGYPATNFHVSNLVFQSDPEKQARYLRFLFSEVQKHGGVELVTHFATRDMVRHMNKLRARSLETPPFISPALIEFYKYFEFIGLYDENGRARPALSLFDAIAGLPIDGTPAFGSPPLTLTSPDGHLRVQVFVDIAGRLRYRVDRDGVTMLEPSPLGVTVDGGDLGAGVISIDADGPIEHTTTYPMLGGHVTATDHHSEWTITARRGAGDRLVSLVVRLFNDGVAYRYVVPGSGARAVSGESSGWVVPPGAIVWHHTNTSNYESPYREAPIGSFDDDLGGPLTIDLPGTNGFLAIGEASLRVYSGMTFDADLASRLLRAEFLDDASWTATGGSVTPWRCTVVSPDLNGLATSDLVANLNDAPDPTLFPAGALTTWITPGKALWSWWSDFYSGYRFETQVEFVNYAASMHIPFVVVDAWWEQGFPANGLDAFQRLAQLTAFARQDGRDIGIWVWKSWNELIDPAARATFLQKVKAAGAVGVKIDNVFASDSESFANVTLYEQILREAASLQLMVNFHGSNKATGLARTYPNEMTREGFMGMEINGILWDQARFVTPHHNAAVPFVRMVAGPGDYTPVTFDPRKMGDTTVAHQLALAGLMTSPLLHYADHPGVLQWYPEVRDFLEAMPTAWDETVVLPFSEIGRIAALARRKGSRWYLFVINGDAQAVRTIPGVSLAFLGAGTYGAVLIGDQTKQTFRRESRTVTAAAALDLSLLPGGGFVATFGPAGEPIATTAALVPMTSFEKTSPSARLAGAVSVASPVSVGPVAATTMAAPASVVPRGARLLSLDATSTEVTDDAVETARFFFGIQGVQLMFDWKDIETAPGVYDASMLDRIDRYYSSKGLAVSLTIRPVDAIHKTVPADLRQTPFDAAQMIYRFASLLDFTFAHLPNVTIASLAIGNEVDEYFRVNPETLPAYKVFYDNAVYAIKTRRPDVKVGVTANLHALTTSGNAGLLEYLNQFSDVVLVLYYPMNFDFTVRGPSVVTADLDALTARYWYKPIHFREAGYPTSAQTGGSEEQQRQFIEEMFKAWDAHADQIELISFFRLTDLSPAQVDYYAAYYRQNISAQFRGFLASLGLRTWFGFGSWKPGFLQFYAETEARGW